mmetsp:Transcript_28261/g.43299  ORF Transcript_28261/g.43299 Transcript_28261/m.43299 type:complete len:193 (-) Transcript_28261:65-643(-)|eukprot:CAMPEP_0194078690 /NCGR_PEP_ID=MMETSP0149-20130528/5023_1 /TAXON_ID=122233 /ORGANISM="Chaetoceros debilis, Strain MM31A-1" /LENGTH=192 /DNA_ID=CAMNT_0038759997 /DNA_START=34 /DNA_END=612 /DNA_ORIENTATION=-
MKLSTITSLLVVLPSASAFAPSKTSSAKLTVCEAHASRRSVLNKAGAALASFAAAGIATPAFAEVAAGNSLPDSAAQFKRLVNLRNDLPSVVKRLNNNADEIDKKEWDNLSDYLRRLYKGGEDMKNFSKTGIYDPEKKKKAEADYKLLQKLAQAGDSPIAKEDAAGLAGILKRIELTLEDFFELLRDVPQDI